MPWSFDMSAAPRGKIVTRTHTTAKGKSYTKDYHVDHRLLVAHPNPDVPVSVSWWLSDEGRWNFYMKDSPPIAWREFPDHPLKGETTPDT